MCVREFRVVFVDLTDWMDNSSFPWAAYHDLMACCVVGLDKRPGVRLVGIEETLCQSISKLVMRAAEDQAKKACGSLQLCTGFEAGIEEVAHAVAQRRRERTAPAQEERAADESEYGSTAAEDNESRD